MPDFYEVDEPPLPEPRKEQGHKGDFGHVLVVAGSRKMMGAAELASIAATRAGCGLVTLACPASMQPHVAQAWPTTMTLPLNETPDGSISLGAWPKIAAFFDRATVMAVGPGLGRNRSTELLVHRLIERSPVPLVLDADALNALEGNTALLQSARVPIIITPHPGEMSRLTGKSVADIQGDRRSAAFRFAECCRCTVVLKGAGTVVAGSGQVYVNTTGNPYMATGGVGDVLTGMVAGLLAQKMSPFEAARTAVYWHGLAADRAPSAGGPGAVTAIDIIEQLRRAGSEIDWYNEEISVGEDGIFDPDVDDESKDKNIESPDEEIKPW